LGVAQVKLHNGVIEGRRAKPFVYSGKLLLSIKDYDIRRNLEIERVRSLSGNNIGFWIESMKLPGEYYEDDNINTLKKLSDKTASRILKYEISTIKQLKNITDDKIKFIANNERGISINGLTKFREAAKKGKEGRAPLPRDHRKTPNPYMSKYGSDNWEVEIEKSTYMSSYVSIKKLIEHMYTATNEIFEGSTHETTWVWYHDALSLMTAKETISWMKDKNYYDRWLLPKLKLQHVPGLERYWDSPTGNNPELMPLDNSLNEDLHQCVLRHCAITKDLMTMTIASLA
jgi:hypothetical protein